MSMFMCVPRSTNVRAFINSTLSAVVFVLPCLYVHHFSNYFSIFSDHNCHHINGTVSLSLSDEMTTTREFFFFPS